MAAPYHRILVPTDFSESAARALAAAGDLALCFGAELVVLHVVPAIPYLLTPTMLEPSPPVADIEAYREEMEKDSQARLSQLAADLGSRGLNVRTRTAYGAVQDQIMSVVREDRIDLIVISTHGISGFRHYFFGSVAEKVVKSSPVAVLVIRSPREEK